MKEIKHKYFDVLKECVKIGGFRAFEGQHKSMEKDFFKAMKTAHPFVFDAKSTEEAMARSSNYELMKESFKGLKKIRNVETEVNFVEEFSLPFKNSLYVLTNPITTIVMPTGDPNHISKMKIHGYLVEEETPEKFFVYVLSEQNDEKIKKQHKLPEDHPGFAVMDFFPVDLKNKREGNTEEILLINNLTNMISVKRIGVETFGGKTFKTKGMGSGYTTLKYDNVIHIADKVEYEYTRPVLDGNIDFDWVGYWRGHWRAFYVQDIKDQFGRNVVDYGKTGKDRQGNYDVPGYTWVTEHTRGNKNLAEIKTRMVITKRG